jgi:hypothetical protein
MNHAATGDAVAGLTEPASADDVLNFPGALLVALPLQTLVLPSLTPRPPKT